MSSGKIQALQVGMRIVDLIVNNNQPMKLTEISAQTNISKSHLYKYLNTLTDLGLLHRDARSGLYMPGIKLIEYGMSSINREDIIERIHPYLLDINRKCNETVLLATWTIHGPMIVNIIPGNKSINIGAQRGSYLAINSSTGKIFSAFMDEYEITDWQNQELSKMSEDQRTEYLQEMEQIRQDHIAFSKRSFPHVQSVSLPVLNHQSKLLAAFTVVGFEGDIPTNKEDELSQYLLQIKDEICQSYGYKG